MTTSTAPLLEAESLVKNFHLSGPFSRSNQVIHAVDGVSLHVDRRETLAVVGESGCGKSTLGRLLMRLIEPTSGSIRLEGKELSGLSGRALLPYRRKIQMI